jgi:hypothetical protein
MFGIMKVDGVLAEMEKDHHHQACECLASVPHPVCRCRAGKRLLHMRCDAARALCDRTERKEGRRTVSREATPQAPYTRASMRVASACSCGTYVDRLIWRVMGLNTICRTSIVQDAGRAQSECRRDLKGKSIRVHGDELA